MTDPEVVIAGIDPAPLRGHDLLPLRLPSGADRDDLPALAEALRDGGDGPVLVLLPAAAPAPAGRRLRLLRSALTGHRAVLPVTTRLPPLGAAVLGSLAASLAPLAPSPGMLVEALALLEDDLVLAAAVPGVARLTTPRPPLGLRLRSLLPGARFLVRAQPGPTVTAIAKARPLPDLLDGDAAGVAVVIAGRGRAADWAPEALAGAFPGAPVDRLPDLAEPGPWGPNAVEAVAYPAHRQALAADLFALPAAPCPWCGEAVATVPCPLCGHDRNPALQEALA